jgi:hypothetical protein
MNLSSKRNEKSRSNQNLSPIYKTNANYAKIILQTNWTYLVISELILKLSKCIDVKFA